MDKLVSVEGRRGAIEDSFETAKNDLGLDHNETRSCHGRHRNVSLVILAFAMMAVIRHQANGTPLKRTMPCRRTTKRSCSAGPSRKSAASPSNSHSGASNLRTSSHGHSGVALTKPKRTALISKEESNCNARLAWTKFGATRPLWRPRSPASKPNSQNLRSFPSL